MKISWREKITNEEVRRRMGCSEECKRLWNNIKQRKLKYAGHILRHDSIQKTLLEGKINGKPGRGRPRHTWFNNIKEWTSLT